VDEKKGPQSENPRWLSKEAKKTVERVFGTWLLSSESSASFPTKKHGITSSPVTEMYKILLRTVHAAMMLKKDRS
jgi:hypothetical protein